MAEQTTQAEQVTVEQIYEMFGSTIFWNWYDPVKESLNDSVRRQDCEYDLTIYEHQEEDRCDRELVFESGEISFPVCRVHVRTDCDGELTASPQDADYIANLPVTQPILFREIQSLRAERDQLQSERNDLCRIIAGHATSFGDLRPYVQSIVDRANQVDEAEIEMKSAVAAERESWQTELANADRATAKARAERDALRACLDGLPKWTPASQPPDDTYGTLLIAYWSNIDGVQVVCQADWDGQIYTVGDGNFDFEQRNVTGWMPMPKGPKLISDAASAEAGR